VRHAGDLPRRLIRRTDLAGPVLAAAAAARNHVDVSAICCKKARIINPAGSLAVRFCPAHFHDHVIVDICPRFPASLDPR